MIIRSQDKYSMTDSLDLRIAKRRPPTEYDYIGEDIYTESGIFLGHYSNEEKAIKVLDMIENEYKKYATIESGFGNIHGAFNIPKCFQMPSDEEVEV